MKPRTMISTPESVLDASYYLHKKKKVDFTHVFKLSLLEQQHVAHRYIQIESLKTIYEHIGVSHMNKS